MGKIKTAIFSQQFSNLKKKSFIISQDEFHWKNWIKIINTTTLYSAKCCFPWPDVNVPWTTKHKTKIQMDRNLDSWRKSPRTSKYAQKSFGYNWFNFFPCVFSIFYPASGLSWRRRRNGASY